MKAMCNGGILAPLVVIIVSTTSIEHMPRCNAHRHMILCTSPAWGWSTTAGNHCHNSRLQVNNLAFMLYCSKVFQEHIRIVLQHTHNSSRSFIQFHVPESLIHTFRCSEPFKGASKGVNFWVPDIAHAKLIIYHMRLDHQLGCTAI